MRAEARREGMGRGQGHGRSSKRTEARGRGGGERGSGLRLGGSAERREWERAVGEVGEGADKRASLVGERERGGGKGVADWATAQEGRKGARGRLGQKGREEKRGISFSFSN